MPKCSFCNTNVEKGTGKVIIEKTGSMRWFCSSKCEKNMIKLGRDPRDVKWTQERK
ncbi:MAG: 50S ribosomal protein L24e [Candidatus Aenigmarchaeota archaeon]|nr:50S ribosomal protein L24e [Candidatus Aenigmarchaeota archaeon]